MSSPRTHFTSFPLSLLSLSYEEAILVPDGYRILNFISENVCVDCLFLLEGKEACPEQTPCRASQTHPGLGAPGQGGTAGGLPGPGGPQGSPRAGHTCPSRPAGSRCPRRCPGSKSSSCCLRGEAERAWEAPLPALPGAGVSPLGCPQGFPSSAALAFGAGPLS